jgi:hypothetical protein
MEYDTACEAYWINPEGKVTPVQESHIKEVLHSPKYFGTTSKYVRSVFDKYGEKYGFEGKAREEIIKDLFEKGWIRVRRKKDMSFTIQTAKLTEAAKTRISLFAKTMNSDPMNAGYSVKLKTDDGETETTFFDLIKL